MSDKHVAPTLDADTDILTLFIYRYLLDNAEFVKSKRCITDQVHDLQQDIKDLTYYPERIDGSYRAEWTTYVKRKLHQLKQQDTQTQQAFWSTLDQNMQHPEQDSALVSALQSIETSLRINQSDKITVIKIPVKTYIQQLIKL